MAGPGASTGLGKHDDAQFERLRSIVRENAETFLDDLTEVLDDSVDERVARMVFAACLRMALAADTSAGGQDLPLSVADELNDAARLAARRTPVPPESRPSVYHDAFVLAARRITRRAFAAGIDRRVLAIWIERMRVVRDQVFDHMGHAMSRERAQLAAAERYVAARSLASVVADPVVRDNVSQARRDARVTVDETWAEKSPVGLDDGDSQFVAAIVRSRSSPADEAGDRARLPRVGELPERSLVALGIPESVVIVPAAAAASIRNLAHLFPDSDVAVGLAAPLRDVGQSLVWCRRALRLRGAGDAPPSTIWCGDMLADLLIEADETLFRRAENDLLQPFSHLSEYRRSILLETLTAMSRRPGAGVPAVAQSLNRHPQTIRYRVRLLRDLVGDSLDDPEWMFAASLVLHAGGGGSTPPV